MVHFVLTGPGRSGTHMLRTALNQHSEIECLDEIFLPEYFEKNSIPEGKLRVGDILNDLPRSPGKKLCGFMALYNELFDSEDAAGLFEELRQRNLRVVHLVRNNLLRRFLSHKLALSTERWQDVDGNHPSTFKVRLNRSEIVHDIKQTLDRADKARALLGGLPFLEISYEQLAGDFNASLARVCKFLGASYEELAPRTFKQERRSLREAVVNYGRLKLLFTGSRYRSFFDE